MYLFYDILLHISLLMLAPYFLFKMAFAGKYRKGVLERFGFIGEEKLKNLYDKKVVWFHAVSVGETKASMLLLKHFKEKYPDAKIIFSTVTATGNAIAMKQGAQWIDSLIYFPFDFHWVVNSVVKRIKPKVFIVVEKEIWPNILKVLKKSNIPALVINGTISDRSFKRYKMFGFFFKRIFGNISCFLCQTKMDGDKAIALGIEPSRVIATGNIKFDIESAQWSPSERDVVMRGLNITGYDDIIIAGSTHAGEEEIVLDVFKRLKQEVSNLRVIIAPRHPERFNEVERLIKGMGFSITRRSVIRSQKQEARSKKQEAQKSLASYLLPIVSHPKSEVILLDTIGELCNFYSIATIAFVGGTLVDIGGHNLLEPAFYKKPVIYGNYLKGYTGMANMLETAGGGIRIKNGEEFFEKAKQLLMDDVYSQKVGSAAYSVVLANKGATDKCLKILEGLFGE
ncbi:MAG: 3-deoxy-D-manno-octulosonic acid transferase [Deltaproteobacteria bacterium]|nr:3-deoxy-D-manno-octulosonic acid transferase [Deltaproteobacteria bacterium]